MPTTAVAAPPPASTALAFSSFFGYNLYQSIHFQGGSARIIAVIDGQGGGLGSSLVSRLKEKLGEGHQLLAVGCNALATSAMLKAGAHKGATGENAVCYNAARADVILGPIGLLSANALMGEVSPAMAAAVSAAPGRKILIPSSSCGILVAGATALKLEEALQSAVALCLQEVGA